MKIAEADLLADLLLDGMHPNDKGHRMIADCPLPLILATRD